MQLNHAFDLDSDSVLAAIDTVLSWDLPDEAYPEAVNAQACHLAGLDADDTWGYDTERTVH